MDATIVCSTCGEENAPDAPFCASCRAYLGWQDDPPLRSPSPELGPGPAPAPPAPVRDDHGPPSPDSFEAGISESDASVSVDGSPATVTVNLANTSSLVDGYVVEAINAPPWLFVRPGKLELLPGTQGVARAELRIDSVLLVPAQHLELLLRVRNTTGHFSYRDLAVQVTVPVIEAPFEVRAEPAVLRTHDRAPGVCTVVIDNARSNDWARVRLSADDPEDVVRITWESPSLQVPPGGEARTVVRFEAPPAGPGAEVSRTVSVTASDAKRRATTNVTFVQSAAPPAMELVVLSLDPSVLRLGGRRHGRLTATLDNRRGGETVQVSLRGDDPENSLAFAFRPPSLQVQPGSVASACVDISASRTPAGREVIRPMTILASDGRADIRAEGSVIQEATSRRGLARALLTVLGGLLILLGTTQPFSTSSTLSAMQLTAAQIAESRNWDPIDLGGFEDVVSIGLGLVGLAVLMVFGLTGRSGRLTRLMAMLGVLVVVGAIVGQVIIDGHFSPDTGALLIIAGCVVGYIGGLLGRR